MVAGVLALRFTGSGLAREYYSREMRLGGDERPPEVWPSPSSGRRWSASAQTCSSRKSAMEVYASMRFSSFVNPWPRREAHLPRRGPRVHEAGEPHRGVHLHRGLPRRARL